MNTHVEKGTQSLILPGLTTWLCLYYSYSRPSSSLKSSVLLTSLCKRFKPSVTTMQFSAGLTLFSVFFPTVMDVTDIITGKMDDEDKQHFIPFQP